MDENPTPRPADERPVFALLTSHWRGHLFGWRGAGAADAVLT
jgi:hypothetical protein